MLSTNMSGGMKAISLDGTRVLERNDPEIREIVLSKLKTAEKVDIVSTGSLYSLIVRVKFMPDKPSGFLWFFSSPEPTRLRDEIVDEHGRLMQNDERWLPTTGKPIREIILKCVVVHPEPRKYTYGFLDDKNMMTIQHVQSEYMVQNTAFDKTKSMFPICPDAISLLNFTDMASFDETFSNPIYRDCAVFQKLREYYSSIPGATVAMIVMESMPASYKSLSHRVMALDPHLIPQVCAIFTVLFYVCKFITVDAHLSNWFYDEKQPKPLKVKLIDFGMSLSVYDKDALAQVVDKYFELHPDDLQQYLKLMGASAGESPSAVMHKAVMSVSIPELPLNAWVHKTLVISMLIDAFANSNPHKNTCKMSNVFNMVYDEACDSMNKMLHTLSLELPAYLEAHPENAARITKILSDTVSYMERYYALRARNLHYDDRVALPGPNMGMLSRYGGKKKRKPTKTRKPRKTSKMRRRRSRRMH
jgi:hypothetical protein